VVISNGRVSGVLLRDQFLPAGVVISAVPWFALAELFDTVPGPLAGVLSNASALGSSPIVTVDLWFADGRGLEDDVVGLPLRKFQWVFDKGRLAGSSQSHLSMVASGADDICAASNRDIVATALDDLGGALPAFRQARLRHSVVLRERRATFSLRPGGPPRPPTRTPVAGLFLAGDWIDTGLPATIESAVMSGHEAAAAVLEGFAPCSQ
jgi:hypothetical protein